jgi:hypothetical protein
VCYSTNPFADLFRRQKRGSANRSVMRVVLGNFVSKEHAIDCAQAWVTHTRGLEAKIVKGPWLCNAYNKQMYCAGEGAEDTEMMRALLTLYGDAQFTALYDEMNAPQQQQLVQ